MKLMQEFPAADLGWSRANWHRKIPRPLGFCGKCSTSSCLCQKPGWSDERCTNFRRTLTKKAATDVHHGRNTVRQPPMRLPEIDVAPAHFSRRLSQGKPILNRVWATPPNFFAAGAECAD